MGKKQLILRTLLLGSWPIGRRNVQLVDKDVVPDTDVRLGNGALVVQMSIVFVAVHFRGHETTRRDATPALADVLLESFDSGVLFDVNLELIRLAMEGYVCDCMIPALFNRKL